VSFTRTSGSNIVGIQAGGGGISANGTISSVVGAQEVFLRGGGTLSGANLTVNNAFNLGSRITGSTNAQIGNVTISGTTAINSGGVLHAASLLGTTNLGALEMSGNGTFNLVAGSNVTNGIVDGATNNITVTYLNGSGTITGAKTGATLTTTGHITINGSTDGTFSGNITNGLTNNVVQISKAGSSTLTLSGNNSYSGATRLAAGTVSLGHANALGVGGNISFSGGTLQYGANSTTDYSSRIVGSGSAVKIGTNSQTVTYTSSLASSNSGGLEKIGAGTLVLAGNNAYTGGTTITAGTLQIGNGGASGSLASSSAISNSGALVFNRSNTLSQGTDFSNSITGAGSLIQNGSGKLLLSANNTYSGATTINAGTIQLTGSIASSPTTINSGGTLMGNGTAGTVTINSGGIISPGNSPGTITVGNSIWESGGNYNWQLYDASGIAGTGWDFISSAGSLTLNATSGNKFNINLWSLSGINPDSNGNALNFSSSTSGSWNVASFAGGISGFSSDIFQFNASATSGTGGFTASGQLGTFSMTSGNNTLTLVYTAPSASGVWVAGSGNWTTAANWQANAVPDNGNPIEFAGAGGTSTNNNALSTVNGITFTASANGSYTVDGSSLEIATGGILNSSAHTQTVGLNLTMNGSSALNADTGDLTVSGAVDNNGSTLTATAASSRTITISGVVSDSGSLIKNGAGTLILNGNNTYSGSTTISLGTLQIGNNSASTLGSGNYSGTIANSGSLVFSSTANQTLAGALSGSGAMVKSSTGTLTLTAANSYSGNITINAGTLEIGGSGVLQNGDLANEILNNGTLSINTSANQTLSGVLSGTGALHKSNSGTLTISSSNTYAGSTTIQAGTVSIATFGNGSAAGSFGASSDATQNLILSGGAILYTGANATANRGFTLANGTSSTINISTSGVSLNLSGNSAASTGSLVKAGTGTLVLTGNNSFTGGTTINAGTLQIGTGGTTGSLSAAGVMTNNATLVFNRSNSLTQGTDFSPSGITGSGSLIKNGIGTLVLNAANTYAGGTVINAGILEIGNGGTTGSLSTTGVISNNGTLVFNRSDSLTQGTDFSSSGITGSGSLIKNGIGTLILNANNTLTGAIQVNSGTLATTGSGGFANSANITVAGGATYNVGVTDQINSINASGSLVLSSGTLTISSSGNSSLSGAISGSGILIKSGTGTLTISNNNTGYTGSTFHGGGVIEIGHDGALGTGNFALRSEGANIRSTDVTDRTIANRFGTFVGDNNANYIFGSAGTGNLTFSNTQTAALNANRTFTISNSVTRFDGIFTGADQGITKQGGGLMILSGNNTYSGITTISTGTLQIGSGGTSGSIASTAVVNNAALVVDRSGTLSLSAVISGTGALTKNGTGTLTLSGNNSYSGATTISAGTIEIGHASAAGSGMITQSSSNTLLKIDTTGTIANNMSVFNVLASQSATLSGAITVNNATWDIDTGDTLTISGTVSGNGGVNKNGSGTLILSGSNSYTGATTVNSGTLQAASANALGSTTAIDVNGGSFLVTAANAVNDDAAINLRGGTLAVNGTLDETVGLLTLSANSVIDLNGFTGTLRFGGVGSWAASANLQIWNWNGINQYGTPVGDGLNNRHVVFTNNAGLSSYLDRISFYSGSGSGFAGTGFEQGFSAPVGSTEIIAVPEPETYLTGIVLLASFGIYRLRSLRRKSFAKGSAFGMTPFQARKAFHDRIEN
jgi:autotransporter-associated beta strand protein